MGVKQENKAETKAGNGIKILKGVQSLFHWNSHAVSKCLWLLFGEIVKLCVIHLCVSLRSTILATLV